MPAINSPYSTTNQEAAKEQVERLTGELEGIEARFNQVLGAGQIVFVSIDAQAHPDIVTRVSVALLAQVTY